MKNVLEEAIKKRRPDSRIPSSYDLNVGEIMELMSMINQGKEKAYDAIVAAYTAGFIRGNHCTINRKMKKL